VAFTEKDPFFRSNAMLWRVKRYNTVSVFLSAVASRHAGGEDQWEWLYLIDLFCVWWCCPLPHPKNVLTRSTTSKRISSCSNKIMMIGCQDLSVTFGWKKNKSLACRNLLLFAEEVVGTKKRVSSSCVSRYRIPQNLYFQQYY
jgi:hypothetical protein